MGQNILPLFGFECKSEAILNSDGSIFCKPEKLVDSNFEFPRYNYKYNGQNYRYCYGSEVDPKSGVPKNGVKFLDLK